MAGKGPRYRFVLVQEPETTLPVRYRRTRPSFSYLVQRSDPMEVLLEALWKLSHRSEGELAWAPSLADNPLAFLLDAMGDAVIVRQREGGMVYANPAARRMGVEPLEQIERRRSFVALERLQLDERRYERRCMAFGDGDRALVLEVLRRME